MKKYLIELNDKEYEVEIEEVTGSTSTEETATTTTKCGNSEQCSDGTAVEAPMPGSILGVNVKVGDKVKKDQVIVILEAMKMENEIVSPLDGEIVSIVVAKGDSVNAGQVLLQIG